MSLLGNSNSINIPRKDTQKQAGYTVYEKANFYIDSRYQVQSILGKGSYGTVCSALDTANKARPVSIAIKKVSNIFTKTLLLKRAVRELKLMRFFKGQRNIVGLLDLDIVYCQPYDGLYCFQELADYDLSRVIYSSVQFSEFHIQSFLYQILCGLKYIHSAEVIHRDLKPSNILVDVQGTLKICDFGLARGISPKYLMPRPNTITSYVATRWYRAPELLLSRRNYSKAIDMWAVGCIFAELYGRMPLFMGNDQLHQTTEILKVLGTPPREIILQYGTSLAWDVFSRPNPIYKPLSWSKVFPYASESAHHLMGKLLCWDMAKRFTVDECIAHPFLEKVRDVNEEAVSYNAFDFSFETTAVSLNDYLILIHEEVEAFKVERMGRMF